MVLQFIWLISLKLLGEVEGSLSGVNTDTDRNGCLLDPHELIITKSLCQWGRIEGWCVFHRAHTRLDRRPCIRIEEHAQLGQRVRVKGAVTTDVTNPGREIWDRDQVIPKPGHQGGGPQVFYAALAIQTGLY